MKNIDKIEDKIEDKLTLVNHDMSIAYTQASSLHATTDSFGGGAYTCANCTYRNQCASCTQRAEYAAEVEYKNIEHEKNTQKLKPAQDRIIEEERALAKTFKAMKLRCRSTPEKERDRKRKAARDVKRS